MRISDGSSDVCSSDLMREMAEAGAPVLEKIQAISAMNRAESGSNLPAEIRAFATMGAVQADDCGECLQIHLNMDRALGVTPRMLQAAMAHRNSDKRSVGKEGVRTCRTRW